MIFADRVAVVSEAPTGLLDAKLRRDGLLVAFKTAAHDPVERSYSAISPIRIGDMSADHLRR
jgi:hypothetical protein